MKAQQKKSCVTSSGLTWHFEDLKDHHEQGLFELFKDPEVKQFFLGKNRPEDSLYKYLERARNYSTLHEGQYDFNKLIINEGNVIGFVSIASYLPTWFSREERIHIGIRKLNTIMLIGYSILGEYRRQGLVEQAVREMITSIHKNHGLRYFAATVNSQNIASQNLLEKLGFVKLPNSIPNADSDRFFLELPSSGDTF
ncbi:MAG: GNAT family N-acetyltransferase [Bdellovibrionota bacterium]|nr:GNAT family N-acetyltransferase [Bdellovibrionota bacterium]